MIKFDQLNVQLLFKAVLLTPAMPLAVSAPAQMEMRTPARQPRESLSKRPRRFDVGPGWNVTDAEQPVVVVAARTEEPGESNAIPWNRSIYRARKAAERIGEQG